MTQPADNISVGLIVERDHRPIASHERNVLYGYRPELEQGEGRRPWVGDHAIAAFWPADSTQRVGGAWSPAYPAILDQAGLRPALTAAEPDTRFVPLAWIGDQTPEQQGEATPSTFRTPFDRQYPPGMAGVMLSGTTETRQENVFLATNELVAHHRGSDGSIFSGDGRYSTPVYDIDRNGSIGRTVHGGLHSAWIVAQMPAQPAVVSPGGAPPALNTHGEFVPAMMFNRARDGTGRGAFFGGSNLGGSAPGGFLSVAGGGPIMAGHGGADKHQLGVAPDGTIWNQGKIWTGALFQRDLIRDAPIDFTGGDYPAAHRGGATMQGVIAYDPKSQHRGFDGSMKEGLWRVYAYSTTAAPTPIALPGLNVQRVEQFIVNFNVNVNINNVVHNHNWWIWFPPINININPPGMRPGIARTPYETGFPSIHGTAVRKKTDQPYDGRFGGPPVDDGGMSPQPTGDTIRGSDPDNLPGSGPGSVDRLFGGDPAGDPIGVRGVDPSAPPPGFTPSPSAPTGFTTGGSAGVVAPPAWWRESPHCWTMHSIGAFNAGRVVATFEKGDYFGDAATCNGTCWFTPPEILPDLEKAPTTTSVATFAVYNGLFEGVACGNAARLGSLSPSQATGGGTDGWYLAASGASDSVEAELRFLNAAGAARNGVLSHYGTLVGGNDGANIGMGDRIVTAVTDAGTDLATVGTDEQLRRYTFAEKAGGYTYNLDLDTTGAVAGATFEFDLELAVVGVGNTTTVLIRDSSGGSTLATVTSALSGAIKRWCKAYYNGSAWVLTALVANLT